MLQGDGLYAEKHDLEGGTRILTAAHRGLWPGAQSQQVGMPSRRRYSDQVVRGRAATNATIASTAHTRGRKLQW